MEEETNVFVLFLDGPEEGKNNLVDLNKSTTIKDWMGDAIVKLNPDAIIRGFSAQTEIKPNLEIGHTYEVRELILEANCKIYIAFEFGKYMTYETVLKNIAKIFARETYKIG